MSVYTIPYGAKKKCSEYPSTEIVSFPKMNPSIKVVWLAALRRPHTKDGHYLQTVRQLHRHRAGQDRFCCLGVLNNILVKQGCNSALVWPTTMPLEETLRWAGVSNDAAAYLAVLNDNGRSFLSIANWIERNL